jgi:hypothetical protein
VCRRGSPEIDDDGCDADADAMTTEAVVVEAMRSIQPYGSLPDGPIRKASVYLAHLHSGHSDASETQICAEFASWRTTRLLCIGPLDLIVDTFFVRMDALRCP